MNIRNCILLLSLSVTNNVFADAVPDPQLSDARHLVKQFAGELKGRLMAGMKEGGPVKAIEVCNVAAPSIAKSLSSEEGWHIGRTSLKTRNSANQPDPWEKAVLQQFETRKANGEEPGKLEYSETVMIYGKPVFRYMKAIPTGELCLACHGSQLGSDVKDALAKLYPDDRATGFKAGDLRGAFSLQRGN